MWAEACALVDEAERMHRRFFDLLATPTAQPAWEPPANVFTVDGDLLIVVALPGAESDNVVVQLMSGGLQIEAHVPPPLVAPRACVVRLEVPYGTMRRRIILPAGRYALIERRLSNGCLHLRLTESSG
jgi:HSP20 family molecular chaperone IbpA